MRLAKTAFYLWLALLGTPAWPMTLEGWTEQRFSLFSSNVWQQSPNQISVQSDGTVSLLWKALPPRLWDVTQAEWRWSVSVGVPATDLTQKGGDDRNMALYFVFMPSAQADAHQGASLTKLLRIPEVRVLMYVWGGEAERGAVLPSPYLGARGRTLIRRPAGLGNFAESVDLAADYARAFGSNKTTLVGLALSADSDDSRTQIRAQLSDLRLN